MSSFVFTIATALVVCAVACATLAILAAFGVIGSDCRYVAETGLACW